MRFFHVAAAGFLLLMSCAAASAQICTSPAQACAAGPYGWGGCYVPGPAQCVSGMICATGTSVCPPGKNGTGVCYDPATARCDDGALAARGGAAPAVNTGIPVENNFAQPAEGAGIANCRSASGDERLAVLSALRIPISADLKTEVEFVVERTRTCGEWAFVIARPRKKGGAAIRWAGTVCAGDTSHLAAGLMRRSGGGWRLIEYALCPSDVAWSDWPDKFKAPQALFDE